MASDATTANIISLVRTNRFGFSNDAQFPKVGLFFRAGNDEKFATDDIALAFPESSSWALLRLPSLYVLYGSHVYTVPEKCAFYRNLASALCGLNGASWTWYSRRVSPRLILHAYVCICIYATRILTLPPFQSIQRDLLVNLVYER